jgi:DtxR family Mn-dependent transcriptional regulator
MLNYTVSEENYIKTIHRLQQYGTVTTNALAAELKSKPASITAMMKKLKAKKLLNYQPYYGFRLSAEGNKVALLIIRRHRLWEYFLAEKLQFSWDEVHEVAEHLEHVSSKKLIDKLDEFLGFPTADPHGDPIPDAQGKIKNIQKVCLTELPLNKPATVCQVADQSPSILELLNHNQIKIGTRVEVKRKFDFDNSLEIKTKQTAPFTISEQLAKNIFLNYAE